MMDQNEKKEWEQRLHSHYFFAKIPPFSRMNQNFAEELAAFAEKHHFEAVFGLIIGSPAPVFTETSAL